MQKLIDSLDPLSLDYLKEKERFEKEMNNPKSWRRDEHIEKAFNRVTERSFVLNFGKRCGLKEGERLDYHRYRSLEKFIGDCLKTYGMYQRSNRSNDPMNDSEFVARLPLHTKAIFDKVGVAATPLEIGTAATLEIGAATEASASTDGTADNEDGQDAQDSLYTDICFFAFGFVILGLVLLEPNRI